MFKKINLCFLLLLLMGCGRKSIPSIIYQDRVVTSYDTIRVESKTTDTIPCDDFKYTFVDKDTIYVEVIKNKLVVKTKVRRDTIFRTPVIIQPQSNVRIRKIDNSVNAKKGGIIGDGNTVTTKKTNWFWIFVAGFLTCLIVDKVILKTLKIYFPFLNLF